MVALVVAGRGGGGAGGDWRGRTEVRAGGGGLRSLLQSTSTVV